MKVYRVDQLFIASVCTITFAVVQMFVQMLLLPTSNTKETTCTFVRWAPGNNLMVTLRCDGVEQEVQSSDDNVISAFLMDPSPKRLKWSPFWGVPRPLEAP